MSRSSLFLATGARGRLAAGLLSGALAGIAACAPDEPPPTAGPEVLREGVDMVIIDMNHYLSRLGVRRARLLADTAEYVSENEIHLRPVELVFFDDEGREISVLTADYGVFNEVSEDMEANGSVVILDRLDDRKLETEHIRYTKEEDRLYGDSAFVMESNSGRTITEGEAFEADPGLDNVLIMRPRGRSEPRVDTLTSEPPDSATVDAADSLPGLPADSLGAGAPDSLTVRDSSSRDTTAVTPDSTARDTTAVTPDSTARDTTVVTPDSTARDTTAVTRDSTGRDATARDTTDRRTTAPAGRRRRAGQRAG